MTSHNSPTSVVAFADGEITRMTTWSANGKPDLRRGIKLARHAYRQRTGKEPPAIAMAQFEIADGATVTTMQFTPDQITKATNDAR